MQFIEVKGPMGSGKSTRIRAMMAADAKKGLKSAKCEQFKPEPDELRMLEKAGVRRLYIEKIE